MTFAPHAFVRRSAAPTAIALVTAVTLLVAVDARAAVCPPCEEFVTPPGGGPGSCQPQADGTLCRKGSGDSCDPDETCSGGVCPPDVVASTTTVCRITAGPCDVPESCPGIAGQPCPSDGFAAGSSICDADLADVCDPTAQCDGAGPTCPQRTLFFDNFNRADGALGSSWTQVTVDPSNLVVSAQRACLGSGSSQSAQWVTPLTALHVRVSFNFVAGDGPQRYSVYAKTADDDEPILGIGGSTTGFYAIVLASHTFSTIGDPFPLSQGAAYRLELEIDHLALTLRIFDASHAVVAQLSTTATSYFVDLGFGLSSRTQPNCIDDFLIEDLCPNATPTATVTETGTATATGTLTATSSSTPTVTATPTVPCPGCLDPIGAPCTSAAECLSGNCAGGACSCGTGCVAGISQIIAAPGDGIHALSSAHRIAVDGSGTAYVTSTGNDNVFKIPALGPIVRVLSSAGDGTHALDQPHSVAVDGMGTVYVSGEGSNNVFKLVAPPFGPITQIIDATGDGTHGLAAPLGVAVDTMGNVYVAGNISDNVFKITPGGIITRLIGAAGDGTHALTAPVAVAVDNSGNVFVAGQVSNNVFKIPPSGPIAQIIDVAGDGTHQLIDPRGLAVDAAGYVYVTSRGTDSAFKIAPSGPITRIISGSGDGTHTLAQAFAVATDAFGSVYVSGELSSNVFQIPPSGPITQVIDATGDGTHALDFPSGLAIDGAGLLYVVGETSNNAFKVSGLCDCPTVTPTPSETATGTVTETATATETRTPRNTKTATATAEPTTDLSGCTAAALFSDNFDRADGALGSDWQSVQNFDAPIISGDQACGFDHNVAVYGQSIASQVVRVSFAFDSTTNGGFEVFAVAQTSGGDAFYAGCDGGTSGFCKPVIGSVVGNVGNALTMGTAIALTTNVRYGLRAVFDNGTITLTIIDSDGMTVLGQLSYAPTASFVHYGMVIGRNATQLHTCIDDFLLEDLCPPATPTATATATGTATATATGTAAPPNTPTVTSTATATVTNSPGAAPSATRTQQPPATATATGTASQTARSTATATRTATASGTATASVTPAATRTSTVSPSPHPVLVDPASAFDGSRQVRGSSTPDCPQLCTSCDGLIHVYDCGPENPPICYDGNDVEIGKCAKAVGFYNCLLQAPLQAKHIIYSTDGCFDPPLVGPSEAVEERATAAPAPALSSTLLVVAVGVLAAIARRRVRRLPPERSRRRN